MSVLTGFCRQRVTLRRRASDGSSDGYEEARYDDPETILARYEPGEGLKRNALGQDVEIRGTFLTEADVKVGDLLEGEEVQGVEPIVAKNGLVLGYEGTL